MELINIITKRKQENLFWWELVFEWEEYFHKILNVSYYHEPKCFSSKLARVLSFIPRLFLPNKPSIVFEMGPHPFRIYNKGNIIPLIIDFYPKDDLLEKLKSAYSKNPIVLISSREVYEYLQRIKYPIPTEHLALSLPDKYALSTTTRFEKTIDLVQVGRISKVMLDFTEIYAQRHPGFTYVMRKWEDGHNVYYTSRGEKIGTFDTRDEYWSLIKRSRVSIYTTSGMDDDKNTGSSFHQVTPRFLELIAAGCHVICRYQQNPDTEYYEMERFSKSVENYEDFEKQLDFALNNEVDMLKYSAYLSKHYTSQRVKQLEQILKKL